MFWWLPPSGSTGGEWVGILPGCTHPWTYPPTTPRTHSLLVTPGGHHWRHTHPSLWADTREIMWAGETLLGNKPRKMQEILSTPMGVVSFQSFTISPTSPDILSPPPTKKHPQKPSLNYIGCSDEPEIKDQYNYAGVSEEWRRRSICTSCLSTNCHVGQWWKR